jgi:hypothetical protein
VRFLLLVMGKKLLLRLLQIQLLGFVQPMFLLLNIWLLLVEVVAQIMVVVVQVDSEQEQDYQLLLTQHIQLLLVQGDLQLLFLLRMDQIVFFPL